MKVFTNVIGAFQAYQEATGAFMDETTNLLRLTLDQYNDLQSVFFNISGSIFEFIPNAQIWPRDLNHIIGGSPDYVYLIFQNVSLINIALPVDSNQRSCC